MIKMPMRIDRKIDRAAANFSDRIADLGHKFRKLIINNHDPLTANTHTNIPTRAE